MTDRTVGTRSGLDPVASGIELASMRLRRYEIDPPGVDLAQAEEIARAYISYAIADAPDRAVELFAEHIGIASMMRAHYGEYALSIEDIASYEPPSRDFLNSFWHDPI